MAGDWIKFEVATLDKPEVMVIADLLDLDPDAVVGKLLRVWSWFDQQSRNGHAPSVTKKLLDRAVGVTGFCDAMQSAGWLIIEGDTMLMPNFDYHNGKSAKNRALGKRRQESRRSNVTQVSRSERDKNETSALPEKRREEYIHTLQGVPVDNFEPTPETLGYLKMRQLPEPTQAHIAAFESHHLQKKTHFADEREVQSAFRKWMATEKVINDAKQQPGGKPRERKETAAELHARVNASAFAPD